MMGKITAKLLVRLLTLDFFFAETYAVMEALSLASMKPNIEITSKF